MTEVDRAGWSNMKFNVNRSAIQRGWPSISEITREKIMGKCCASEAEQLTALTIKQGEGDVHFHFQFPCSFHPNEEMAHPNEENNHPNEETTHPNWENNHTQMRRTLSHMK